MAHLCIEREYFGARLCEPRDLSRAVGLGNVAQDSSELLRGAAGPPYGGHSRRRLTGHIGCNGRDRCQSLISRFDTRHAGESICVLSFERTYMVA